jgi:hypothetical protein
LWGIIAMAKKAAMVKENIFWGTTAIRHDTSIPLS